MIKGLIGHHWNVKPIGNDLGIFLLLVTSEVSPDYHLKSMGFVSHMGPTKALLLNILVLRAIGHIK